MNASDLEYIKALLKWQADVAAWVAAEVARTLAGSGGVTTQSGNDGPPPPPPPQK